MIQVALRVMVWVLVLGGAYILFGPELFDSSESTNPFASDSVLFLPPPKSPRLVEYEEMLKQRALTAEEAAEYRSLVKDRQSRFWQREGTSVEDALAGVKSQRKQRLVEILSQRGMTQDESAVFFMVLERDHPSLLADRE